MQPPQPLPGTAHLSALVTKHCSAKGYALVGPETDKDGYLNFEVSTAAHGSRTHLSFNGEVFNLTFPGGYGWGQFAQYPEDMSEALTDALAFLDAYADPETREVEVNRRLRRPRLELHVSNGAVLRRRGWSKGPPQSRED